jgi:Xaa-Pro aminopeptidase
MPVRYAASSAAYKNRREELQTLVKKMYPEKKGLIMLFAQFEPQCTPFKQDPSFYYYTGVQEPAAVLTLDVESGKSIIFVPNFGTERVKWIADALVPSEKRAHELEVDALEYLGDICAGYTMYPFFEKREYTNVLMKNKLFLYAIRFARMRTLIKNL